VAWTELTQMNDAWFYHLQRNLKSGERLSADSVVPC